MKFKIKAFCFLCVISCVSPKDKVHKAEGEGSPEYSVFHLKNYKKASYFVPNTESIAAPCEKITPQSIEFEKKILKTSPTSQKECTKKALSCEKLEFLGTVSLNQNWGVLRHPLFNIHQWDKKFPAIPIKISTVFFEVEYLDGWPHIMPCTNIFGYVKTSDQHEIGNVSENYQFDYFVVNTNDTQSEIDFVSYAEMNDKIKKQATMVINGFILIKDGKIIENIGNNSDSKNLGYCRQKNGRLGVGLRDDDMFFFNVSNVNKNKTGMTCSELAKMMISDYKITHAMIFDSGGSATISVSFPDLDFVTPSSDSQGYRPFPLFMGITPQVRDDFNLIYNNFSK